MPLDQFAPRPFWRDRNTFAPRQEWPRAHTRNHADRVYWTRDMQGEAILNKFALERLLAPDNRVNILDLDRLPTTPEELAGARVGEDWATHDIWWLEQQYFLTQAPLFERAIAFIRQQDERRYPWDSRTIVIHHHYMFGNDWFPRWKIERDKAAKRGKLSPWATDKLKKFVERDAARKAAAAKAVASRTHGYLEES